VLFACFNRRLPNFTEPATFNAKVNWRILQDRRPALAWTCDKLAMKEHARAIVGLSVPRTYWAGSDLRELQGAVLPAHWVLKPNHRSGLVYFGHGRPDASRLRELTATWLDPVQATKLGEWAYTRARPMLLAEEVIGDPGSSPPDYKFFVFGGEVAVIQVDTGRHTVHRRRFHRPDWSPLEVRSAGFPLAPAEPPPESLGRMLAVAAELGGVRLHPGRPVRRAREGLLRRGDALPRRRPQTVRARLVRHRTRRPLATPGANPLTGPIASRKHSLISTGGQLPFGVH
jgi:hypothetical protein